MAVDLNAALTTLARLNRANTSAIELYRADFATPETLEAMRFWAQGELNRIQSGFASTDEVIKTLSSLLRDIISVIDDRIISELDDKLNIADYDPFKMKWRFPYVEGGPYLTNDTTRESIFTGVANQTTTESLAPVITGIPFYPADGAIYTNLFQLLGVKVGNQYTMASEAVVLAGRVDIAPENVGLLTISSLHINDVQIVETVYLPRTSGIHAYNIAPVAVFIGDVVRVEVDIVHQTGNTQVHYFESVAFWDTYSNPLFSNEQGLFDEVPNTNAYGIDLEFVEADASDQWDILAVSSGSLAPNEPLQADERTWVQTSTDNLVKFEVSTTANGWTEIGRYLVADLSAVRGSAWVTGTRTDGTLDAFYYESRALITRDGTVNEQVQEICNFTPHPTVGFQSTVVGNELVFEVRGSAVSSQTWDWKMIYFVRDIT